MRIYTLPMNKVSTNINDLLAELKRLGFSQLPEDAVPTITRTKVYVNEKGQVATILSKEGKHSLVYRQVNPIDKDISGKKKELRVYIDGHSHAVHKLVALTYPSFCGKWSPDKEIHHIIDHLDNRPAALICVEPEVHYLIHKLLKTDAKDRVQKHLINHITYNNELTIEDLEGLRHA